MHEVANKLHTHCPFNTQKTKTNSQRLQWRRSVINVIKVDSQQQQTAESLGGLKFVQRPVFAKLLSRETRAIDARNNSRSGAVRRSVAVTLSVAVARSLLLCLLRESVAGRSARHLTADSGAGCAVRAA